MIDDRKEIIKRLIETHGEEGLSPTAADWTAILELPSDKPVNILNLIKFKSQVQTPEGTISGIEAYGKYSRGVGPAFAKNGGKRLYFGKINYIFGTVAGTNWDTAILTEYPTPEALAKFWLDEEFIAGHEHRNDGVESSRVLVMNSL